MEDLSKKVALVLDNGIFVDFANKLGQHFNKVYYFCEWKDSFPKMNKSYIGYGLENIEVVHYIWDLIDKIDIFIFLDLYYADLQNYLTRIGKRVWGMKSAEELENNRIYAKETMAKLGLPVSPYTVVTGISALRDYLKKHDNVYVKINKWRGTFETFHSENYKMIEPKLDEVEHQLGAFKYILPFVIEEELQNRVEIGSDMYVVDGQYPSKILTGLEIKDQGYLCQFRDYKDIPYEVTDFNSKIAPVLQQYGSRGFFSTEIRVGVDHKPYMIDFCFDKETEILTNEGWKLFKDLNKNEKVVTLNNGYIEYQKPTDYINYHYEGKLINISNKKKTIESTTTPNHLILRTNRKGNLIKERADSLTGRGYIPRTGKWVGSNEAFILPEYNNEWDWYSGEFNRYNRHSGDVMTLDKPQYKITTKIKNEPALKINMKDWAAFLGWYLSEGSTSEYVTTISQTKHPDKVKEVLDRLPFKYNYNGKSFRISSVQLGIYMKMFGLCSNKFVPEYIKNATPEIIKEFLNAFNLGDGNINKGYRSYFTTSKKLADDIQELIFKIGLVSNIVKQNTKGTIAKINDKEYIRNHNIYIIYESNKQLNYWFETGSRKNNYITEIDYNDQVYCVTVPNSTIYVRKNGKPFWSSNCARLGSPPNELYQDMFENIGDIIWSGSEGILVDPISTYKFGAELIIHSSWADKNWQPINFPPEIRDYIKLRSACKINNQYYVIPQAIGLPEIGAVIGLGNTKEEAIANCKENAKLIKGYYIDIYPDALDKAEKELQKTQALGIEIFD